MTATASTTAAPSKDALFQAVNANEWGQITGLEPNAAYFVVRRPTKELTREKSEEFVAELRTFLHQRREMTEKQVRELNEKYGATAKAKAQELREQLERRFDELTKEFEARVEKLEHELGERADRILAKARPHDGAAATGAPSPAATETPGEMPHGEDVHAEPATDAAGGETKPKGGKKGPRRSD